MSPAHARRWSLRLALLAASAALTLALVGRSWASRAAALPFAIAATALFLANRQENRR